MANPLSNPVIGGMVGTLGALIIAGAGYYAYTSTTLLKPNPLSRMHSTCEAAVSHDPNAASNLKGLSATTFCGCIVDVIYPSFSEPMRDYVQDLYDRVEKNAPASASARFAYDADFADRLKAVFQADQFSHMGSAIQLVTELNQINGKDMGPECNLLK